MSSAAPVSLCIRGNQGILKMKNDNSWKCVGRKEVKNKGTGSGESNKLCIFFYISFFMIINLNSCFVYCFLILADVHFIWVPVFMSPPALNQLLTESWWDQNNWSCASIHCYGGAALCSQDGRRGIWQRQRSSMEGCQTQKHVGTWMTMRGNRCAKRPHLASTLLKICGGSVMRFAGKHQIANRQMNTLSS